MTRPSPLTKKVVAHHNSDGSELIPPAEKANSFDSKISISTGYIVDDEGIINNYATEPNTSLANNLSPKQQKPYILFGIGATLFIAIALATAFNLN